MKLRDLVLSTRRDRGILDAAPLGVAVLEQLDPENYREALEQALPAFCRAVTVGIRAPGPFTPPPPPGAVCSAKVTARREWWQKRLDEDYEGTDGRKLLRHFTYDDLLHLAELLRNQASQKMARARGCEALAAALTEHDVKEVGDLPAEVLEPALGAAA